MLRHTPRSTLLLTKCTLASPIITWTPPGCRLEAETCIAMLVMLLWRNGMPAHETEPGTATWLYRVQQFSPMTQLAPHLLVSGVAVATLVAMQVVQASLMVDAGEDGFVIVYKSDLG